jgi:ribosomal protein S19E (S16A)
MQMTLTPAMIRELRSISITGEPSDPYEWTRAQALWFHAREKVLTALINRGLINGDSGDYVLTDAGRTALDQHSRGSVHAHAIPKMQP